MNCYRRTGYEPAAIFPDMAALNIKIAMYMGCLPRDTTYVDATQLPITGTTSQRQNARPTGLNLPISSISELIAVLGAAVRLDLALFVVAF